MSEVGEELIEGCVVWEGGDGAGGGRMRGAELGEALVLMRGGEKKKRTSVGNCGRLLVGLEGAMGRGGGKSAQGGVG